MDVEPRIQVITLAVDDLERSLAFYRELGFDAPGVTGTQYVGDDTKPSGRVVMFRLHDGLTLALYGREDLAKDANVPVVPPTPGHFSIGHIVGSKAEVDELLRRAEAAGATLTEAPYERAWQIYSGYFRDLDGHLWEIIFNQRS